MIWNHEVRNTLLVTVASFVALEVLFYFVITLPNANDVSAGFSTFSFIYVIAPSLAIGIGLGTGIFRALKKHSFAPTRPFLSIVLNGVASIVVGIAASLFALLMILQVVRMM